MDDSKPPFSQPADPQEQPSSHRKKSNSRSKSKDKPSHENPRGSKYRPRAVPYTDEQIQAIENGDTGEDEVLNHENMSVRFGPNM
jgi:hypothetical protein